MAKAEMILKAVMTRIESPSAFVIQCRKLLPDFQTSEFQKILDMKVVSAVLNHYNHQKHYFPPFFFQGLKKTEQTQLMEEFKQRASTEESTESASNAAQDSPEHEAGRIKRLEKLIKKRM